MYYLGLDTYEEGEMYIKGEETSGYTEKDGESLSEGWDCKIRCLSRDGRKPEFCSDNAGSK